MTWRRYLLLVVALLVAGSLITPTAGFSSAAADRNVDVAVVSDDEAYLGIQRECSDNTLQVTVTNRFSAGTTLDVDIAVNGTTKTIDDLSSGESQSKAFNAFDTNDTATIAASGSGISVHLTRSLPTGC
ncbi:hypothetical protein [Halobellus ordinarius]|uniref:hypothetical protein n=1 Tax=Halobellus ordinarius TaxID=3075120 RepID=UPI002880369F|nr:hypothetical protein [Halobellus sp. ZY16]